MPDEALLRWCERVGIVGVVAVALAAGQHVRRVMPIVVPLRSRAHGLQRGIALEKAGDVGVVLQHQVHMALPPRPRTQRLRDLAADVLRGAVIDGVHGVQAQAVHAELLDPVQRVVHEEVAHRAAVRAVERDRRAPGRAARGVEELVGVGVQVVALGSEVVVDHVQQHHQLEAVRGFDQALQVLGRAVRRVGREGQHTVVTPATPAREVGQGHQLDSRHAERRQLGQALGRRGEAARLGERADMQLVDDRLVPRPAAPAGVAPVVGRGVDDDARAMHVVGIAA